MHKLAKLKSEQPLNKVPSKNANNIRYFTFNVNGIKTFFNHHPWNQLQNSVDDALSAVDADIVSLQELKVQQDAVALIGMTTRYRAFILVPKSKKGYSGVGLYVRIPTPHDPPHVAASLSVVKAEEGITGRLKTATGKCYHELPSDESIGGYLDDSEIQYLGIDSKSLQNIDAEGRCAVVETANNTVVFSLYCPANSMGSGEGQLFRLRFLELLLKRVARLKEQGKHVVVMGDMNVSPDLIDNADNINERIKSKVIINNLKDGGETFERTNENECLAFRTAAQHRALLNLYMIPTLDSAPRVPSQFLLDSTRLIQKRRLALYTVWNTLTSARQSNYGSRIDLILFSDQTFGDSISKADILPYLFGSDHCPVFTDVDVSFEKIEALANQSKLGFEAKSFYKLVKHRNIATMFGSAKRERKQASEESQSMRESRSPSSEPHAKKSKYVTRKSNNSQQPINNFFFNANLKPQPEETDLPESGSTSKKLTSPASNRSVKVDPISMFSTIMYDTPPKCFHGEQCILRTSLTKETKGKKFWLCPREAKGSSTEFGEHRCNYFKWARKSN